MRILFFGVLSFFMLLSCEDKVVKKEVVENKVSTVFIDGKKLPRNRIINAQIADEINTWTAFKEMNTSFETVFAIKKKTDLFLFIEEMIEKEKTVSKNKYPKALDVPQIKSRIVVLKTLLLKINANLKEGGVSKKEYQQDLSTIVDIMNAIKKQFEQVLIHTFDEELLSEE